MLWTTTALLLLETLAPTWILSIAPHARQGDDPVQDVRQAAAPCVKPPYRAFDFWVGDWEVRLADGSFAGLNTVSRLAQGCGVAENWRGAKGSNGRSLNYYDAADSQWHQDWVGSSGLVLHLAGGITPDGSMSMQGHGSNSTSLQRITWTPLPDGRVRQRWEGSDDGGKTWSVLFQGFYSRLPTPESLRVGKACDTPQGHRFDFWAGEWRVESYLMAGDSAWKQTEGVWRADRRLDGCGFLDYTSGDFGDGSLAGVGSRFYDPATDQWIVTWVDTQNPGKMGTWTGRFGSDGSGVFLRSTETPKGVARSRIRWKNVKEDSADWDYSVSRGGEDAWRVVWRMRFTRVGRARR